MTPVEYYGLFLKSMEVDLRVIQSCIENSRNVSPQVIQEFNEAARGLAQAAILYAVTFN